MAKCFGFQPDFDETADSFNVLHRVGRAVHAKRHQQLLSRTNQFGVLQPILQTAGDEQANLHIFIQMPELRKSFIRILKRWYFRHSIYLANATQGEEKFEEIPVDEIRRLSASKLVFHGFQDDIFHNFFVPPEPTKHNPNSSQLNIKLLSNASRSLLTTETNARETFRTFRIIFKAYLFSGGMISTVSESDKPDLKFWMSSSSG